MGDPGRDPKDRMIDAAGDFEYRRPRNPVNLDTLLLAMHGRHSSNPIDKVFAIAFPFQKRETHNVHNVTFPIYDPSTPVPVAWETLISSIASAKMEVEDLSEYRLGPYGTGYDFARTPTIQLLCLFPHPSRNHWFPSWTQLQQYPDVSVREIAPVPTQSLQQYPDVPAREIAPVPIKSRRFYFNLSRLWTSHAKANAGGMDYSVQAGDKDYSLRIMSGRIYRGCSLELKRPPTSNEKAAYHCSMGSASKVVELVATVRGIELNIDSRRSYVLVDISPDCSLWSSKNCPWDTVEHVHPPIWRNSVIIVCEEVDSLAHAQPVRVTTSSSAILRYRLRRITTLEWECSPLIVPDNGIRHWLPFKPSLEHMRSVVCSAEGGSRSKTSRCPPDVFCDPAAVKSGWRKWNKCPVYEVYLV